jgi:hypothetical protein
MANALASSVPLASRADVVASMRRLDMGGTPGSGIRALSPTELAVRRNARAERAERDGMHTPPVIIIDMPPAHHDGEVDGRRTTMSVLRRTKAKKAKARSSLVVRLSTVGLLGIALGAAQAAFGVVPTERIEPYVARVLPPNTRLPWKKAKAATAATPAVTTATPTTATPTTSPVMTAPPVVAASPVEAASAAPEPSPPSASPSAPTATNAKPRRSEKPRR